VRSRLALALVGLGIAAATACNGPDVRVGSKKFTESVVLGDLAQHLLSGAGFDVEHRRELGGTRILWEALLAGEIDVYPEYTGTLRQEILVGQKIAEGDAALAAALAARGVRMGRPLGFSDSYAIGMREDTAERLGIRTLSDLARHPRVALGLSHEFLERADGWPALRARYGMPHLSVRGLDHDVAYRAVDSGSIEATDLYSTDAEIRHYRFRVLEDDLGHFPAYRAVFLYRADFPDAGVRALDRLGDRINEEAMIAMNARAVLDRVSECQVAADFLVGAVGGGPATCAGQGLAARLRDRTIEHLFLVAVSLTAALLVALPLGILCARRRRLGAIVLGTVGVMQTIPSLALLVLFIPLLGIGALPAMAAMFLYALLPIVRNTATGLLDIPPPLRESAQALGLGSGARLRLVELPMASRAILAGIKTSAVLAVGNATLGALIGAGGYGQPILSGIRRDDTAQILEGALPAAALAILLVGLFALIERLAVPRGLRLQPAQRDTAE
jgi:osmoprotectant transport system permease protein